MIENELKLIKQQHHVKTHKNKPCIGLHPNLFVFYSIAFVSVLFGCSRARPKFIWIKNIGVSSLFTDFVYLPILQSLVFFIERYSMTCRIKGKREDSIEMVLSNIFFSIRNYELTRSSWSLSLTFLYCLLLDTRNGAANWITTNVNSNRFFSLSPDRIITSYNERIYQNIKTIMMNNREVMNFDDRWPMSSYITTPFVIGEFNSIFSFIAKKKKQKLLPTLA